jgi:thioredoxin reductase (NADPH)
VLAAVGRYADTRLLGLQNLPSPMKINPQTGKLYCIHEQTSVPHIYAVGDVIEGTPELTPAAILAGKLLAQRLFSGARKLNKDDFMDYPSIPTTVFTPLELGTVGLTEEAARSKYGDENVDCYISAFLPLEWSLPSLSAEETDEEDASSSSGAAGGQHRKMTCYLKVVVDISRSKVNADLSPSIIGIHIASPHAGEVIQGFAVAFRKGGLTYSDLMHSVGIHPTIAEEFTTVSITKSSGEKVEKTSC